MENILIENENHKNQFIRLLDYIDDGLLDDEDIIQDLGNFLRNLSSNDKFYALQVIQRKYASSSFYLSGNFQIQSEVMQSQKQDYKLMYKQLEESGNENKFVHMLQNSDFCKQNSIPNIISNNIVVLKELGTAIFDFVNLILIMVNSPENIPDFQILRQSIPFIYSNQINQLVSRKACAIIGSIMIKYIYQIQYFIDLVKEHGDKEFQELQNEVLNAQLKITVQNNQQQLGKSKEYIILSKLLKLNYQNYQQHLDEYLCKNLNLNKQQLTDQIILQKLDLLYLNISELIMIFAWYFWTNYVLDFQKIQQKLIFLDQKFSSLNDERRIDFTRRTIQRLIEANQDEICSFYLYHWIFFDSEQENTFNTQKYLTYKKEYQDSLINYKSFEHQFEFTQIKLLSEEQLQGILRNWIQKNNNLILWAFYIDNSFFDKIKRIIHNQEINMINLPQELEKSFGQCSRLFIANLLILVSEIRNFDRRKTQLLIKLFLATKKLHQAEILFKFDDFLNVQRKDSKLTIQAAFHITIQQLKLFSSFYPREQIIDSVTVIFQNHLKKINLIDANSINQLGKFLLIISPQGSDYLKCFKILIKNIDSRLLHFLLRSNQKNFPLTASVKITLITLNILHDKISPQYQNDLWQNLHLFFPDSLYKFQLIHKLKQEKVEIKTIIKVVLVYYFQTKGVSSKLIDFCQQIFNQNPQFYVKFFEPTKFLDCLQITPQIFQRNRIMTQYPNKMNIKLEQFNQAIIELDEKKQASLVENWIIDTKNQQSFLQLIPIFFNIIKREENPKQFLNSLNFSNSGEKQRIFNTKALFQLLFNNANDELKVILLKFRQKESSVPLIFQELTNENIQKEEDLFAFNHHLFYVLPQSYPIINFNLSQSNSSYGKTHLLNEMFYQMEKFQICDFNELNRNTIDIMFDFCFNGTRNFAIADQHGQIPLSIMKRILPFFRLWIIQMHTEIELQENFSAVQQIQEECMISPLICFIVRDSQQVLQQQYQGIIQRIENAKITIHFLQDLNENGLDQQIKQMRIESVSKLIFSIIEKDYHIQHLINHQSFIRIMRDFYHENNSQLIDQFTNYAVIIQEMEQELNQLFLSELSFFSSKAFPFRALEYSIYSIKNEIDLLSSDFSQTQIKINFLENKKSNVFFTKILQLFKSILSSQNYYAFYLLFVDKIRKFNQDSTFLLQNEMLKDLKYQKDLMNEKKNIQDQRPEVKQQQIQKELERVEAKIEENEINMKQKNISVEIFWREALNQQQFCKQNDCFNSTIILYQMLQKGEPIEILDGDSLKINYYLLKQIANYFQHQGNERILVMSVLGPQSAGKSTIYNKMFGCHLWTNVGRCTKGIFLQLLKVHNKEQSNNQIDYILLLDTEGLQSSNQKDQEFDKKIALFILAISDIIIITVKGDIHKQFRSLIEMCVYSLGQLQESFSCKKQLSWCFNQNNDDSQIHPFLEQLSDIAKNMNEVQQKSLNKNELDYKDVLDINKENIKVLGIATQQKDWKNAEKLQMAKQWCLRTNTESFSKEVHNYGLSLISNYLQQAKTPSECTEMSTFNQFIHLIESIWESIQRLPDLLEFSELIHHFQNEKMKLEFEKIISREYIQKTINIKQNILDKVTNQQNITLSNLDQIAQNTIDDVTNYLLQKQRNIFEELEKFKQKERIQKNILIKCKLRLEKYIKSMLSEFKIQIFEQIAIQQRQYQENQGFAQLDKFIQQLSINNEKLLQYQQNPQMIKETFNQMWDEIKKRFIKQQNQIFQEFFEMQYQIITQKFAQSLLKTDIEKQYKNTIFKICKTNPFLDQQEQVNMFSMFSQELQQTQFTSLDGYYKNYSYMKNYNQPILNKIKSQTQNDLIDIKQLFKFKVEWFSIDVENLFDYLQNSSFQNDFLKLLKNQNLLDQHHESFFQIFEQFGFEYDRQILIQLFDAISYQKDDLINYHFRQLAQSIKLHRMQQKKIFLDEISSIHFFQFLYPELKLKLITQSFQHIEEVEQQRKELVNQCALVMEIMTVEPVKNLVQIHNLIEKGKFNLIKNQTTLWFSQIMEDQDSWRKLYSQIYNLIKTKLMERQSKLINQKEEQNKSIENNLINCSAISIIMSDVQQKIQDLNLYFSNYGIIFNGLGERCIQYFAVLTIWRFVCFFKWQQIQSTTNLQEIEYSQFTKFEAEITQNKVALSRIIAKELADNIKVGFLDEFYEKAKQRVKEKIQSESISSYQLIKQLDEYFFQTNDNTILEQTVQYLSDQRSYIKGYVQLKIQQIEAQITKTEQEQLMKDLLIFFNVILQNSYSLNQQLTVEIKTKDYFNHKIIQEDMEFYEQKLYDIVLNCLLGDEVQNLQQIDEHYQQIFSYGYKKPEPQINIKESSKRIPELKHFIQEFCDYLRKIIIKIQFNCQLDKNKLKIQEELDLIRIKMNGCQETCPICNRKCDQDFDVHDKHLCQNGHQIRGINGVLINDRLSHQFCEEVDDQYEVTDEEFISFISWGRKKMERFPNWSFICCDQNAFELHKQRLVQIWDTGIGERFCKIHQPRYTNLLKFEIISNVGKSILLKNKIHYIIVLDTSGQMRGENWLKAKNTVTKCVDIIKRNPDARVSIIFFGYFAYLKIDCTDASRISEDIFDVWKYGFTRFSPAFDKLYHLIDRHKNRDFESIAILFYSNSQASFPNDQMLLFQKFNYNLCQKISFFVCTDNTNLQTLNQIVQALEQIGLKKVKLQGDLSADDLQFVWPEFIIKNTSQLR